MRSATKATKRSATKATKRSATKATKVTRGSATKATKVLSAAKPYHHGDLRPALVEAAAVLLAERPAAEVSLRAIARRAGVSVAAPYHYFADKSALIAAVATRGFELFDDAQAAALEGAPADPAARLAALGAAYVRFALDRPHFFRVMFRPHLVDKAAYPELAEVAGRAFDRLVDTVRAARLAQGHEDPDPIVPALLVWAIPHGLAALWLDGPASAAAATPRLLEQLAEAAAAPLAAADLRALSPEGDWGV